MKNITVLPLLVTIIYTFSAIYSVNSEELIKNTEHSAEDNGQSAGNNNPDAVNHDAPAVNETPNIRTSEKLKRYGFSFGAHFGIIHGQAVELVYPTDTKGKYLSELLWDIKPLYYLGFNIDVGLKDVMGGKGYFSTLSFMAGLPNISGIMEDRDWMSIENSKLTHFSRHANMTDYFFMIDWKNGFSFPVSFFYFKPFLNLSWMNFSFSGKDGYGKRARAKEFDKYGNGVKFFPISDNPERYDFSGVTVILYEQNWLLLAPGVIFGTNILSPFSFNLSFQISPLTFCYAVDHHLTSYKTYYDYTGVGLFIEGGANISLKYKFMEFAFEFTYRYIGDTKGVTKLNENIGYLLNNSGAGLSMMNTRFIIKFMPKNL